MSEHHVPERLRTLLIITIESIDRLDILLHLRVNRTRSYSPEMLGRVLHMGAAFVEEQLAVLCGLGYLTVNIGSDLTYGYQPTSITLDANVLELEALNRQHRAAIMDLLDPNGRED
jgi:hypothetical protein